MDTPRKTKLYNQIAKDYLPKQADMMICRYIEGLEQRIEVLEAKLAELGQHPEAKPEEGKTTAKGRKKNTASALMPTSALVPDEDPEQPLPAESEMPTEEPTTID